MEPLISELAEAWKQVFLAEDEASLREWGEKAKKCERELYKEKRRIYLHFYQENYDKRKYYVPKPRPKHYNKPNSKHSDTAEYRKAYQKKYYQEIRKPKLQERKRQDEQS